MELSDLKVLAIVPARGGSKGIPRKNLVNFRGKPLISYTLDAIKKSKLITRTIVSSDSEEIIEFCKNLGFYSQYIRPEYLGLDDTPMREVIKDIVNWIGQESEIIYNYVIVLQPTSPLRSSNDIDSFIKFMYELKLNSALSFHKMREHPMDCIVIDEQKNWKYLVQPPKNAFGRQLYPNNFYFINGSLYGYSFKFLEQDSGFNEDLPLDVFFEVPRSRGLEIDYLDDLMI
jgi:CMP-N,N'-diacetyllegionaminic acid synthase